MKIDVKNVPDLKNRWTHLEGKKSTHVSQAEEYAQWTLPYIFPATNVSGVELQLAKDSIGAQAVNHLSNKVVSTLFPPQRMFFRLHITEDMKMIVKQAMAAEGGDVEAASETLNQALVALEEQLGDSEKKAQDYMDMVSYRPQAVTAAKLLIITGNALMYHPADQPVQVYNLRDYCVVRDLSGRWVEVMTKESKAFETFSPAVQEKLRLGDPVKKTQNLKYEDHQEVTIYTRIVLEDDGKYHVYQCGDHVMLDTEGAVFAADKCPWIPLAWNLVRGEDYGRGLVADYSGAFHAVNTLTNSLLNIAAIMADIKFLVNPSSLLDVGRLNSSPAGSYHSGKEGDITTVKLEMQANAQFIATMIDRYEKQIAQAFLLNSSLTRDAERVTAEEIRAQANELETSNGGIYSRLAATWQVPTAAIVLDQIQFEGVGEGIVPKVITGMDSLSRTGELDNIRLFMNDLAMLNNVPEDVRAAIKMSEFASIIGTNRQVEFKKFIKSPQQMAAEQQQAMAQQQQLIDSQAKADSQVAASKQAMTEE